MPIAFPSELHQSSHQARIDGSLVGEYTMKIYPGSVGPVVVFDKGDGSPLPIEYLSERAVRLFLTELPNGLARSFERSSGAEGDTWTELIVRGGEVLRDSCRESVVQNALASV